jgi:hypothetical protein
MKTKLLSTLTMFLCLNLIYSQQAITSDLKEVIPQEAIDAISEITEITSVFSVGNDEHFDGQIIRANEIVFSENARLTLDNVDAPWIVLIADKIKFQNPNKPARIMFGSTDINIPPKATTGSNGANGSGRSGRHGRPGAHGQTGTTGTKGYTKSLPHIYIITKELTSPTGSPAFAPLAILGNGFRGSQGGQGGNGGNGVKGQDSSSGAFDCRRGGGNGGNGGNAGQGGKGGDGGNGGDGVSITVVSNSSSNDAFSYIQLLNSGGIGGPGGSPGIAGNPGASGGMGRGGGHCSGGRSGSSGSVPNRTNLEYGSEGKTGKKGSFTLVTAPDLESIFENN